MRYLSPGTDVHARSVPRLHADRIQRPADPHAQRADAREPAVAEQVPGFQPARRRRRQHRIRHPTLRGIWDTFPLLLSGSAGLEVVGAEPTFGACTPGSSGCCTQLQSPITPAGNAVPEQHLDVSTKDALRAMLTAPLAVAGTGHGAALGLDALELADLMAYLRSL